ncbi:4Fe-4S dicluster domain-containing protein [Chloroflexota bacterium]
MSLIQRRTGENVLSCYQCGKCTAGCPTAYEMDISPRQIMRGLQLGLRDEILQSSTIWLCVSCQTCSVRCPREIDIAKVMEELRLLSQAEQRKPAQKEVVLFHRIFLSQIKYFGRIYELGIGILYNLRSRHILSNVRSVPKLLAKGKLKPLPPRTRGVTQARQITKQAKRLESEFERIYDDRS